ncbi:serine/arginine-rich splicing factor 6-like isoform X1 [Neolamprologus brichardi]|uniref:serine/arginine-rich splicing factor 6-like isoform X1 n=1 Tax=Neolamprologus brichardi TaxID=32507 RepID=UPI00164391C7|nr:serine/arginine-rich splicing factor 6-like isoform X1 [Neolamprologus brichardi]
MPRVYVGKLSYHVREKDIQRFFSGYGKLLEIDLKNGYGFVEFEDMRDADDAVYELNGKELCGERVVIEHARGPRRDGYGYGGRKGGGYSSWNRTGRDKYGPPVRTEHRLIVENLSSRCSWQDLKDFMRQAGEVTYADAHKGRANEGVIEFRSRSDMKRALEKLDGTDINGRKIRLVEDKPRRRRSYSGSRSRSRSRRRSHSRRSRSSSRSRSRSRSRSKGRSRSRSEGKSHSRSKRKSRSKSPEKSRSRTRKSHSPSKSSTRKSRSKSSSKVKATRKSRSRSKEKSSSKKSRSRSRSRSESRGEKHTSKSPPSKEASKSPAKRSASRSKSRSRSRSASQD